MALSPLRLGVNIDHVATIRNARGHRHPDPIWAAHLAARAGAHGITAHLREDRRHISDADIARLKAEIELPLNLEMAATEEMLEIALRTRPNACCLVPEKRQERTTEGGLDVLGQMAVLTPYIARLRAAGIRISLFIEATPEQVDAAKQVGADIVELHTGTYCEVSGSARDFELAKLQQAATYAHQLGLEVHAGHGLTYDTVGGVAAIPEMVELNIGHFLIGEAIFLGLEPAIQRMLQEMSAARGHAA